MKLKERFLCGVMALLASFNSPCVVFADDAKSTSDKKALIASLPEAITSFGAARVGDALYVYGGHTGSAHSYWNESQSDSLLKLDLATPSSQWTKISQGPRIQGLAMVAHGDRLIRIGGFEALNAKGAPQDLRSIKSVAAFDTKTGSWSQLPELPEPRSSHDAAIIGDVVYVAGGWDLNGGKDSRWHTTAWSLNLADSNAQWQELPKPNFVRRALALVGHQGKLFAIGGMGENGGPTKATSFLDLASGKWSEGPELAGDQGMVGFGAAAWSNGKQLLVSSYDGKLQQLADDMSKWNVIGNTKDARFFHRLLPFNEGHLLSVGGASMESGKFEAPELIDFPTR